MLWFFIGPILLLIVGIAVLLPYASFRLAVRNSLRRDGRWSARRAQREGRYLAAFLREGALVPLSALVLLQAGVFVVHHHVVPDTTLSDLFGEYHPEVSLHAPDLEAWNEAIEANRRDRDYEAWRQAQGLAPATAPSFREALVEHWPLHVVFPVLALAYLVWFFSRRYFAAAQRYHRGVVRRAQRQALRAAAVALPERS